MNFIKLTGVPFFKHLFYEYFVYVDSSDYKADDIFISNNIKGKIMGEWCHPEEKYWLINIRINKKDVGTFKDSMKQLENKQLISGNTDYTENAEYLCNQILGLAKE